MLSGHATTTLESDGELSPRERARTDFPYWAEKFAKIVDKKANLIPFALKDGQRELDRRLCEQRDNGRPQRAIVLKARQLGFSTYAQGKLIHNCTQRERFDAAVVAHDRETGAKLYRIGERIYANLPENPDLKPGLGKYRRSRDLHFAGDGLWQKGELYPDSSYTVDTAGEFEAGRGGTYRGLHLSEVAFWPQISQKLTALMQTVPDDPDTLVIYESTANGYNAFKDLWDDAEAGRSDFLAFFWPWHKDPEYSRAFASETEREAFTIGDASNPYAEREPELVQELGLTPEQLNWRRYAIANKCAGDLRKFDQEYPTVPEDAFIATGQKVFDSYRVGQLMKRVETTDPRPPTLENPGPIIGDFKAERMETQINRRGDSIEVPASALWVPRPRGLPNPTAPFRLYLPQDALDGDGHLRKDPLEEDETPPARRDYIAVLDPSGGNTESTKETDYHAIQVIDHKTLEQVAVYRSRIEPEEVALVLLMVCRFFNDAWAGVERTGGWGMPILRILWLDYHYPFVYRSKRTGQVSEKTEARLGWSTDQRTKPDLIAGMGGLLKDGIDGIKDRETAEEVRTYTRTASGQTEAEPGKYDDLLMAYMIAQQLARELPRRGDLFSGPTEQPFRAQGISGYDTRY